MKRGKGKSKGNRFENVAARIFSEWVTGGVDKHQLIPSRLSGGWTTRHTSFEAGWRHLGDLAPNGPAGEALRRYFVVECKHHRTIDLWQLWTRGQRGATLRGYWAKLRRDIMAFRREHRVPDTMPLHPLIIFRANNRPLMVVVNKAVFSALPGRPIFSTISWEDFYLLELDVLTHCAPQKLIDFTISP